MLRRDKCPASALFPLPWLSLGTRTRPAPNGRKVQRRARRVAAVNLANVLLAFLNFEAGGRRWDCALPPTSKETPAQQAVLARALEAARAMLCVEGSAADLRSLAIGRGKIAQGWDTLAAIQSATRGLADLSYKSAIAVGELPRGHDDTAVDVLPDRLKLPAHAATVPLEQYLSGAVRDGYLRPSSLEFDLLRSAECDGPAPCQDSGTECGFGSSASRRQGGGKRR